VLAGLVSSVGAAGLAGASGSHPARRGGVPEVWPVAPPRGVVVPTGELDRLRASAAGSGREVEVGRLRSGASRTFVARDGSLVRRFSAFGGVPAGELSWGAGGSGLLARLSLGGSSLEVGVDADLPRFGRHFCGCCILYVYHMRVSSLSLSRRSGVCVSGG